MSQPSLKSLNRYLPLAWLSAIVLALEVFLTRLLAYTIPPLLVYFVIGIAMLGFGTAGTLVSLKQEWLTKKAVDRALAWSALAFTLTTVLAYACFVRMAPQASFSIGLRLFAASFLLTVPFVAAGSVVTLALTSAGGDLGKCYAANLLGSGLGCFIPLLLLGPLDGDQLLALLAALSFVPACLYVRRVKGPGRLKAATAGTGLVVLVAGLSPSGVFPILPEPFGQIAIIRQFTEPLNIDTVTRYDRWNPTGRIEVLEFQHANGEPDPLMFFAQDNSTGALMATWDGGTESETTPERRLTTPVPQMCGQTIYGQAYYRKRPRILVIGIGGGSDIQCALYKGATEIDAVEINPDSIEAIRFFDDKLGGIASHAGVHYYLRDGRSFVHTSHSNAYDLIQLTGVDTKNMLASGSLGLSENHLYTTEAYVDYLKSLKPNGVLSLVRFTEMAALRMAGTAVDALRRLGVQNPENNIVIVKHGLAYGILARRTPFQAPELRQIHAHFDYSERPFSGFRVVFLEPFGFDFHERPEVLYLPGSTPRAPYKHYFDQVSQGSTAAFEAAYPARISPPTDNRPFFFDMARYDRASGWATPHVFVMKYALGSVLLLALGMVLWPALRGRVRDGASWKAPAYFAGIGLGYLLIEVWLLHTYAMYLGHQTYSLSVVLMTLLVTTGLGAQFGHRVVQERRERAMFGICVTLACVAFGLSALPIMLEATWAMPFPVRAGIAMMFIAPMGGAMGCAFPAALRWLSETHSRAVPWCVGINSFTSVVATVIAIPLSLFSGYTAVLGVGVAAYVLALACTGMMRPATSGT